MDRAFAAKSRAQSGASVLEHNGGNQKDCRNNLDDVDNHVNACSLTEKLTTVNDWPAFLPLGGDLS